MSPANADRARTRASAALFTLLVPVLLGDSQALGSLSHCPSQEDSAHRDQGPFSSTNPKESMPASLCLALLLLPPLLLGPHMPQELVTSLISLPTVTLGPSQLLLLAGHRSLLL